MPERYRNRAGVMFVSGPGSQVCFLLHNWEPETGKYHGKITEKLIKYPF